MTPENEAALQRLLEATTPLDVMSLEPKPTIHIPVVFDWYPRITELTIYGDWSEYAGVFWIHPRKSSHWAQCSLFGAYGAWYLPAHNLNMGDPNARRAIKLISECVAALERP